MVLYMSKISDARERLVEAFGRIFKEWGFGFTPGVVFGTLYLSNKPLTMDEIADETGYSLTSVHNSLRILLRLGLVTRRRIVGLRKAKFKPIESERHLIALFINKVKENIKIMISTTEYTMSLLRNDNSEKGRFCFERAERLNRFYRFLSRKVEEAEKSMEVDGIEW